MPTQPPARLTLPVTVPPRALEMALAAYDEGGHHDEAVEYALTAAAPLILAANTPPAPGRWVRRHARELAAAGSLVVVAVLAAVIATATFGGAA